MLLATWLWFLTSVTIGFTLSHDPLFYGMGVGVAVWFAGNSIGHFLYALVRR